MSLSLCGPCLQPGPPLNPAYAFLCPAAAEAPPGLLKKNAKQQLILQLVEFVNPLNSSTERGLKMKVWKENTPSICL